MDYNPMQYFQKWFYEATELFQEREPNALSLTTLGADSCPKSRIVLLKKYTWEGFIFFSNYQSEKATDLSLHPKASLLFNWVKSNRMIEILGTVSKISESESKNYFELRPRGSKIGAWASPQSKVISSRELLERRYDEYENKFENQEVPKPFYWGGFILKPSKFHFYEKKGGIFNHQESYSLSDDLSWLKNTQIFIKSD